MGNPLIPNPGMSTGAIFMLVFSALVLVASLILKRRKEKRSQIRQLPAFQNLRKQIERAAESNRPIHITLGSGRLSSQDTITSLAALQIVESLADWIISYNVSPIITVGDPTLLPLVQDVLRRAYERHHVPELYAPRRVRFIAPTPMAYAAGTANVVATEDLIASVSTGTFGPEVSLIADAAAQRDLPQSAAADAPHAIGALYPATEYLAVGEELYTAGAQITGEQPYVAGLLAQDISRIALVLVILVTTVMAFLGI